MVLAIIMGVAMIGNLGLKDGMPGHFSRGKCHRIMRIPVRQGREYEGNGDGERGDGPEALEQRRKQNSKGRR